MLNETVNSLTNLDRAKELLFNSDELFKKKNQFSNLMEPVKQINFNNPISMVCQTRTSEENVPLIGATSVNFTKDFFQQTGVDEPSAATASNEIPMKLSTTVVKQFQFTLETLIKIELILRILDEPRNFQNINKGISCFKEKVNIVKAKKYLELDEICAKFRYLNHIEKCFCKPTIGKAEQKIEMAKSVDSTVVASPEVTCPEVACPEQIDADALMMNEVQVLHEAQPWLEEEGKRLEPKPSKIPVPIRRRLDEKKVPNQKTGLKY